MSENQETPIDDIDDELDEIEELEEDDVEATEDDLSDENDRWITLDEQDWRDDGPFDINEVDLDADDVQRIDLGTVIITPFDGMQMQLKVDENSQAVEACLVVHEQSAIEISVFAAPAATSMLADIRNEMVAATTGAGGDVSLAEGPFGTEIRRVIPLQNAEGQQVYHVSRTWFAQGPRWLLRGIVMGQAGLEEGIEGPSELLYEFFSNCVVRRGSDPMVPGNLIPMVLPEGLLQNNE